MKAVLTAVVKEVLDTVSVFSLIHETHEIVWVNVYNNVYNQQAAYECVTVLGYAFVSNPYIKVHGLSFANNQHAVNVCTFINITAIVQRNMNFQP